MAAKRKTLPKNFKDLLKTASIEELIPILEKCELNAYDGYGKQTALSFDNCPHELAQWLIAKRLDIETLDRYEYTPLQSRSRYPNATIKSLLELGADVHLNNRNGTPLHCAARNHQVENTKLLLEYGADTHALAPNFYGINDGENYTPLASSLLACQNIDIEKMVEISNLLLKAGAEKTLLIKKLVTKIGKEFKHVRERFNPLYVDQTSEALHELYTIFDVVPVPRIVLHDE